ncbi:tumor necrosis factor receptor superfamily member 5 [Thalassophryne amazonica]|uniref:tumor necrosis factor receptor superfamily member 5 n=1 Tax=Thalassophryne amazonica TaxID=390379 RepID=UPI0014709473|nr:tumor necrosis factor receptor superfamily member 5 [Thalassophryne amazonica]
MFDAQLNGLRMATTGCKSDDMYRVPDGKCCDRCPAGTYVHTECDGTKKTECAQCVHGYYTASKNYLRKCQKCRDCYSNNNHRTVTVCTASEDTQCECVTGFYCSDTQCEHCRPVTHCPVGHGVKVKATRMNNTICAPCEEGTYSNVSDFHSACQTHSRCEDLGKVLKIHGTATADAVCGHFKSHCNWVLPAGLWAGLIVTSLLLLLGITCWRVKRRRHRAARANLDIGPGVPACPLQPPLPSTELSGHCQESCEVDCEKTIFNPDHKVVFCCTQESVKDSFPTTPRTASLSYVESSHTNGKAGNWTSTSLTIHSEPQEDEWCGM